mgnify:CR=1 FL=1
MLVRMARYLWRHRRTLPVTFTLRFLRGLGHDRTQRRERFVALQAKLVRALKSRGLLKEA